MGGDENIVHNIVEISDCGVTITDIVKQSGLSRGVVRIHLARLEGAKKILFKEVGMAKLYFMEYK